MFAMIWKSAAALTLLGFAYGCKPAERPAAPPPEVEVITVQATPVTEYLTAIGEIKPYDEVALVARVDGFLRKRNFKEGERVKKDAVLFEIEPENYEAQVKADEATLEKCRAQLDRAKTDFDRQSKLVKDDAVSHREYDLAKATKMEAEANVKAAEAELDKARRNLSYTKIRAPFDGVIGLAPVSEGNLVNAQTGTLATMAADRKMRVEFVLSENDVLMLRKFHTDTVKKDEVPVRLFLEDGQPYGKTGVISFWNNRFNTSTGTLKLQAVFDNPDGKLISGMFAHLRLEPPQPRLALQVPQSALMNDQIGDYLYVVGADGKVARRTVKTGFRSDTQVVILEHLKPGERVVVNGLQKVRPGVTAKTVEGGDKPHVQ